MRKHTATAVSRIPSEHTGFIHARARAHTNAQTLNVGHTHTSHIPNNELAIAVKGLREYRSSYAPNAKITCTHLALA